MPWLPYHERFSFFQRYCPLDHALLWRDFEDAKRTFSSIGECVRHERVQPGLRDREFYDRAAAGRDGNRLVSDHVVGRVAVNIGINESADLQMRSEDREFYCGKCS